MKEKTKGVLIMLKKTVLPMTLLILCAAALMVACGNALSQVFLQLRSPLFFYGL